MPSSGTLIRPKEKNILTIKRASPRRFLRWQNPAFHPPRRHKPIMTGITCTFPIRHNRVLWRMGNWKNLKIIKRVALWRQKTPKMGLVVYWWGLGE
jgi:hypothetical protein